MCYMAGFRLQLGSLRGRIYEPCHEPKATGDRAWRCWFQQPKRRVAQPRRNPDMAPCERLKRCCQGQGTRWSWKLLTVERLVGAKTNGFRVQGTKRLQDQTMEAQFGLSTSISSTRARAPVGATVTTAAVSTD